MSVINTNVSATLAANAILRNDSAKPPRRYELLGAISLLSPEYLLSFERWPFHAEPPDHYALLSYLIDL